MLPCTSGSPTRRTTSGGPPSVHLCGFGGLVRHLKRVHHLSVEEIPEEHSQCADDIHPGGIAHITLRVEVARDVILGDL